MPDILPGARPTRMELIALRKRRNIAQRGQDLLREQLGASTMGASAKLDEAVDLMTEAVKNVVELSAAEEAIRRLAEAIAATKRRVNSLEYIVIPRILNTIRYIEMSLQERAREDFFRLKRIKTRLEEEKEEELMNQPIMS